MASSCQLIINGRQVAARIGETLVDAGLGGWIAIPHDCSSGQCETCRVEIVAGTVDDHGTRDGRTVLACQATVCGNAAIKFDESFPARKKSGLVKSISRLTHNVLEVVVSVASSFVYRPGQYVNLKFLGFPGRDMSPTAPADGSVDDRELIFHIARYPRGLVSTQIGSTIRAGHRVQIQGPFGYAFLREGDGPLVLVAGGTGWAPIWSVAAAACQQQPHREMIVIAGVRANQDFYMGPCLNWLRDQGVQQVIATAENLGSADLMVGRPTHYLPSLGLEDTVYVAGPPGLVDAVKAKARAAAARCYADPFLPSAEKLSLIDRFMRLLNSPTSSGAQETTSETGSREAVLPGGRRLEPRGRESEPEKSLSRPKLRRGKERTDN